MVTYLVLNLIFIATTVIVLLAFRALHWNKVMTRILVLLIVLTVIFDSFIIMAGIVSYEPGKILGVRLGAAPVEDLMYAVLAAVIIPAIWKKLGVKHVQ